MPRKSQKGTKTKGKKKQYPKTQSSERRMVIYYPQVGKVRLISTWKPDGDVEAFAETMAQYMDAELRIKEG